MVKITEELLRKRSEHNDGILTTLEEITLHQFNIEKIECIGEHCRSLKILYLQHNLIEKIENLNHLKRLEYLNLALNSIRKVENLEKNEELRKLDLTINYVDDVLSIENLQKNPHLHDLYLVGNPCASYEGYRHFVVETLPQLNRLDGHVITKEERIEAKQKYSIVREKIVEIQKATIEKNTREMLSKKPIFNENGERLYGNDPISRKLAARELQRIDEERKKLDEERKKKMEEDNPKNQLRSKLTPEQEVEKYGKVMQKNEGKWKFKLIDNGKEYHLSVPIGKYCPLSVVNMKVKGQRLCLRFEENVSPSKAVALRSSVTGALKITIPKEEKIVQK